MSVNTGGSDQVRIEELEQINKDLMTVINDYEEVEAESTKRIEELEGIINKASGRDAESTSEPLIDNSYTGQIDHLTKQNEILEMAIAIYCREDAPTRTDDFENDREAIVWFVDNYVELDRQAAKEVGDEC